MVVAVSNLRLKIYRLALDGCCQRKIASLLCTSRQDVYYHIKFLMAHDYLSCKNSSESPKLYAPTDKTYNPHKESKKDERGGRLCRVHCIGYICDVIQSPCVKIHWENTFRNNGTTYSDKHWNTDLGRVTIRLLSTSKGSKVIFWLPEKYLDNEQLNHWKQLEERYAEIFYDEFQKRYDCRLGQLSRYQKPEFAFQEDSEFLFLREKYNIKSGNSWVDQSEGSPEWETNDYELAKAKMEMPERLIKLETNVERLIEGFSRIESSMKRFETSIKKLNDMFSQPVRKDTKEGYA